MKRFSGVGTGGVLVSQCSRLSQGHEAGREKKRGRHLEEIEQTNNKMIYLERSH